MTETTYRAKDAFGRIREQYECIDHRHAVAILTQDFPELFLEICGVLENLRIPEAFIKAPGGNESQIPKLFSGLLRPIGWIEEKLTARVLVDDKEIRSDSHKVDYVKGNVAFDLEWNSKDQTFDRDLYAFRAFFEYHRIAAGVLVTRSNDLDPYFAELGEYIDKNGARRRYRDKFGASTTHMGKLVGRLEAGRGGGCPILAVGITQKQVEKDR